MNPGQTMLSSERNTTEGNNQGSDKEARRATGKKYPDVTSSFAPGRLDTLENKHLQVASKSLLMYAAYYDDVRKPARITIVGIRGQNFSSPSVNCSFSNTKDHQQGHTTHFSSTSGRVEDLPDHHSYWVSAVNRIHLLLKEGKLRPDHVSVVCHNDSVPNLLQITYPYKGPHRYQFSMCVSPVYGGYNIWRQSLESMEMARMLGVDHVNVYVEKAGPNLTRVLQHYVDQGFMSVLPWNGIPSNVHAHAQVGCMHDCLLRMRYVTKYVVFIDLDELIILRTNNTLREMVEHVLKQTKDADKVGAIMVRNSFFHHAPQEKINITDTYLQANLTGGLFTKARLYDLKSVLMQFRGKPWEPPQRCRTIADPLRVDTMAVHHPETMFGDFKVVVVDPKIGLLHHYRYGWHNEDTRSSTQRCL
ncbi:hypothetical protein C0Q70_10815 [Pomacea canaliculata]|uniref:Glycosyltransferase family 92 protein n=1 Tax=Pomacea canaliculata TaxID=400727 RepID=A0A2T7P491_POMCA|nr:hypothetical protein C0Q70_10815 [Pomacea canaliculata]